LGYLYGMTRRIAAGGVVMLLVASLSSGCSWFHRGQGTPSGSPDQSSSQSQTNTSASTSTIAQRELSDVLTRTRNAGGATVQIAVRLTGVSSSTFSGVLDLVSGEGQGDYTNSAGRVVQRIIKGGKTYTEAGSSWIATAQSGRGLVGGDFPSLWRAVNAASLMATDSNSYQGDISVSTAMQLAGIDANAVARLNLTGAKATLTLTYDADGVIQGLTINADLPASAATLAVNATISDVGQIVDVTAPTVAITGGPEGQ
jgi:hypothetical protein